MKSKYDRRRGFRLVDLLWVFPTMALLYFGAQFFHLIP